MTSHREELWRDGWLWIRTAPDGKWNKATVTEMLEALAGRVAKLEALAGRVVAVLEELTLIEERLRQP